MNRPTPRSVRLARSVSSVSAVLFALSTAATVQAQEHSHGPIDLDLPPIAVPIPAALTQPRRCVVDGRGRLLVADWNGKLVRISEGGRSQETLADGLRQPTGIAVAKSGDVYVSQFADGAPAAGSLLLIRPEGVRETVASKLDAPSAVAVDSSGVIYVADFRGGEIDRLDADGSVRPHATGLPGVCALAFSAGELFCVCAGDGSVRRVFADGESRVVAGGLSSPSDLAVLEDGRLLVASFGAGELIAVDRSGEFRPYAIVPSATIGVATGERDSLYLLDWSDATILKVTTRTTIRCPHCGEPIELRLRGRPNPKPAPPGDGII